MSNFSIIKLQMKLNWLSTCVRFVALIFAQYCYRSLIVKETRTLLFSLDCDNRMYYKYLEKIHLPTCCLHNVL